MNSALNEAQWAALRWINEGMPGGAADANPIKLSARALVTRSLARVSGRGPTWAAELTEAGKYYLEHGKYPPGHRYAEPPPAPPPPVKARRPRPTAKPSPPPPIPDYEVDSPRGMRERGNRPRGDRLFDENNPDPFDERILISVKEAAWMLSLPEGALHKAAREGDIDRVFIGEGGKNYRLVYGAVLAWVNDMPREPASVRKWWR